MIHSSKRGRWILSLNSENGTLIDIGNLTLKNSEAVVTVDDTVDVAVLEGDVLVLEVAVVVGDVLVVAVVVCVLLSVNVGVLVAVEVSVLVGDVLVV